MDKRLTRLALQLGIASDKLPTKIGMSAKVIALVDKGHAALSPTQIRIVAQCLATNEATVKAALLGPPEPRSAAMLSRLSQLRAGIEHELGGQPFERFKIDRIAAECFPDELERR